MTGARTRMGKLDGKVALITGAARGMGRSHAITLAQLGADIIAIDVCRQIDTVLYPLSTPQELAETVRLVEGCGRRIAAFEVDVRDRAGLGDAVASGAGLLGGVDIVLANAGIAPMATSDPQAFIDAIDVNLVGVWNTVEVSKPLLIAQARGGAIVLTSSVAGLKGLGGSDPGGLGYTASKHAIVGLMRSYSIQLAPHNVRVNSVNPTGVNTPMVVNEPMAAHFASGDSGGAPNLLAVDMIESIDVSNAIAWLVSDEARYVTGVALPIDAGLLVK